MIGLSHVNLVQVPAAVATACQEHLRHVGRKGFEGFALWAGVLEGSTFTVREAVIPAQKGVRSQSGVLVSVDAAELHRLNVWLFERGYRLMAQLHSHPGRAYHSDTDDTFPISTTIGSLSLVIPDFAREPFSLNRCAVYRLSGQLKWTELPPADAATLIHMLP